MRLKHLLIAALTVVSLSGCSFFSNLVYKIDIPQGNYIEDNQVERLRIDMTKEQVNYVLGTPMLTDSFDKDIWNYLYRYKSGKGELTSKQLVLTFSGDQLKSVVGDYPVSADFNTPLDK